MLMKSIVELDVGAIGTCVILRLGHSIIEFSSCCTNSTFAEVLAQYMCEIQTLKS